MSFNVVLPSTVRYTTVYSTNLLVCEFRLSLVFLCYQQCIHEHLSGKL